MIAKLRMVPLVMALVVSFFAFPSPVKSCHLVLCEEIAMVPCDTDACEAWCFNTNAECTDAAVCALNNTRCKCFVCV